MNYSTQPLGTLLRRRAELEIGQLGHREDRVTQRACLSLTSLPVNVARRTSYREELGGGAWEEWSMMMSRVGGARAAGSIVGVACELSPPLKHSAVACRVLGIVS